MRLKGPSSGRWRGLIFEMSSSEEPAAEIAVYECGEEIAEETAAAACRRNTSGEKMDVVAVMSLPCQKGGEVIECHGYYHWKALCPGIRLSDKRAFWAVI